MVLDLPFCQDQVLNRTEEAGFAVRKQKRILEVGREIYVHWVALFTIALRLVFWLLYSGSVTEFEEADGDDSMYVVEARSEAIV